MELFDTGEQLGMVVKDNLELIDRVIVLGKRRGERRRRTAGRPLPGHERFLSPSRGAVVELERAPRLCGDNAAAGNDERVLVRQRNLTLESDRSKGILDERARPGEENGGVAILSPDKDVAPGSRVR